MINNPVASGDNRSSAFWIIANMCIDNDNTRNALIAEPLLLSGMRMQTDPVLVQDVYYLWNFLMANPPFPMPEHIQVIWNSLPYTQDDSNLTLLRRGVMRLVKSSALYQEWAFRNPDVMRVMSNVAAFYGCLIKHNELRDITLQQGMLDTLCNFLNDFNIENRIWALLALTNLTKHVPNQILAHRFIIERVIEMIRAVDENRVQHELYYFIIHLLANSETARIMLIEKDVMCVFASLFESVIMREDVPLMHDGMGVLLDLFHAYPHCMQRFEELGGRESVEMFEFSDSQDLLLRADKICTLLGAPPK